MDGRGEGGQPAARQRRLSLPVPPRLTRAGAKTDPLPVRPKLAGAAAVPFLLGVLDPRFDPLREDCDPSHPTWITPWADEIALRTLALAITAGACSDLPNDTLHTDRPVTAEFVEVFRVGDMDPPDWAQFGTPPSLGFDGGGNLFVLNPDFPVVAVLDRDGGLVRTMGTERQGARGVQQPRRHLRLEGRHGGRGGPRQGHLCRVRSRWLLRPSGEHVGRPRRGLWNDGVPERCQAASRCCCAGSRAA